MTDDHAATAAGERERQRPALSWLNALRATFGLPEPQLARAALEDALKENGDTSSFSKVEREMILRLLGFGTSRVQDIMVPRADVIAVETSAPLQDLLETFERAGVSRVPIYRDSLDDPTGMIHVKDLFRWLMAEARTPNGDASATGAGALDATRIDLARPVSDADIVRPVLYAPPSMMAAELLARMQAKRIHLALIVDEFGGTDGLLTIEDLVEQIVGDIEDEHDEMEAANIVTDPDMGVVASARTPIEEIEEHLGLKLLERHEEEDIDTLGGLVLSIAGGVPAQGARVRHKSGVEFEVLDADPRRLNKLRVDASGLTARAG